MSVTGSSHRFGWLLPHLQTLRWGKRLHDPSEGVIRNGVGAGAHAQNHAS